MRHRDAATTGLRAVTVDAPAGRTGCRRAEPALADAPAGSGRQPGPAAGGRNRGEPCCPTVRDRRTPAERRHRSRPLEEFGRRKANELLEKESSLPEIAAPHFRPDVVDPFAQSPVQTVRRILNWTPDTGGGLFGHNQDDHALTYYNQARDAGAVGALTVEQRIRLVRNLLDGYTADDEGDAAFDLLTADTAHSGTVIAAVGWDRLEDELVDRFSRRFPESGGR
jgi:hypothetical protein